MPMRLIQAMLAMLVALLLGVTPATAQTYPKFTGLVVDAANVLPPATKADLTAKLEALQKDTKRQLVVATIPDLQGQEIVEYGVGLGRAWGVGLKGANNGAILFIAPNAPKGHRGPRLVVGYSLEPILTDAFAGTMIREKMMPKLTQSGDIAGAMEAGTDAVIAQLRASPEEAKANVDAAAALVFYLLLVQLILQSLLSLCYYQYPKLLVHQEKILNHQFQIFLLLHF